MTETEARYEIGQAEFQRALELLQQEQKYFAVSRWQRVLYRIYAVFFWMFIVGIGVALAFLFFDLVVKPALHMRPASASWVDLAIGIGLVLMVLGFVLMAVFIPFNLPLFIKIFRQWGRLKKLGFAGASRMMWKQESRRRRVAHWAAKISLWMGVLIIIAAAVTAAIEKSAAYLWFALPGVIFVFYAMLQSGKAFIEMIAGHLKELMDLQSSLQGLQAQAATAGTERIAIPTAAMEKLAQFDAVRIARDRANAIYAAKEAEPTEFAVLLSSEVYGVKAELDDDARLKVEDAVEQLMQRPVRDDARQDGDGRFHFPVAGTELEIVYEVDQAQQRVLLLHIQNSPIAEGHHA